MLCEFFTFGKTAEGWAAGQASVFDLKSNRAPRVGLSRCGRVADFSGRRPVRQIHRGRVEHAMRVTVTADPTRLHRSRDAFRQPTRGPGVSTDGRTDPAEGRLRHRGFSPAIQAILKGLKKYGMLVADNGIDWAISVTPDPRIPTLHEELRQIKGANFEVVVPPE